MQGPLTKVQTAPPGEALLPVAQHATPAGKSVRCGVGAGHSYPYPPPPRGTGNDPRLSVAGTGSWGNESA